MTNRSHFAHVQVVRGFRGLIFLENKGTERRAFGEAVIQTHEAGQQQFLTTATAGRKVFLGLRSSSKSQLGMYTGVLQDGAQGAPEKIKEK